MSNPHPFNNLMPNTPDKPKSPEIQTEKPDQQKNPAELRAERITEVNRDLEILGQDDGEMTDTEKGEARKNLIDLSREKRALELDTELEDFSDYERAFAEAREKGEQWKIKADILKDPEKQGRYAEYRKKLVEKMLLDVMPELEKTIPNLNYYITKNIEELAVGRGLEGDTQILIAVEEASPDEDPDRSVRTAIIKKLIELGLANDVALGEKFSGRSDRYQAYLDFVFFHKDKNGVYKSIRPDSEYVPKEKQDSAIGKKLPDKLNHSNTFQEIAPEDFEEGISFPEYFRDDVVYNGIYLKGSEFIKKLNLYTKTGELTEEQKKLIEQGYVEEQDFFSPAEAENIKKARLEQYRATNELGKKYFGQDILDQQTLQEIEKNLSEAEFDKILADKTGAEIEENIKKSELSPDLIPNINGLSKEDIREIFEDLLKHSFLGHGNGGLTIKNELIAYPNKPETEIPILVLANSPEVIGAREQLEELLKEKHQKYDSRELHDKVVEFMKEIVAGFKGQNKESYWKERDKYELIKRK